MNKKKRTNVGTRYEIWTTTPEGRDVRCTAGHDRVQIYRQAAGLARKHGTAKVYECFSRLVDTITAASADRAEKGVAK